MSGTKEIGHSKAASDGRGRERVCLQCGAGEPHITCPICSGRGCISGRELAERLGLRDALDATELTAEAVAKAVDGRVLDCFEAARKIERERADQLIGVERQKLAKEQQGQEEQLRNVIKELTELRRSQAEFEARAKQAEDALARRRLQPASIGRAAERDFAALVGTQSDFRVSAKLAKAGDYEVWVKADLGDGTLSEVAEPILVDVKRESAALQEAGLQKLVRDCKAKGRLAGALVADKLEEVAEIFGTPRLRTVEGVVILLSSVEAFTSDVRLIAPYLRQVVDARRSGNAQLVAILGDHLGELAEVVGTIEGQADAIAGVLEKQAKVLRDNVVNKICGRARQVHRRVDDQVPERPDRGHVGGTEQSVWLHVDGHMGAEPARLVRDPANVHHPVHGPVGDLRRPGTVRLLRTGRDRETGRGVEASAPLD
jgi:hypothetical protein